MKKIRLSISLTVITLLLAGCHKHTYNPATCVLPQTCSECGKTDGDPLGHSYAAATCTEPQTCTRCGVTTGNPLPHDFEDATCKVPKTCKVCGQTEGRTLDHDFADATCEEPKTCTRCGEKEGMSLGHKFEEVKCTEAQECERCGKKIAAPGHKFIAATCTEPETCSVCGETKGEALGHDIANNKCKRCGAEIEDIDTIKAVCGLKAQCQTNIEACKIFIDTAHNPYDVEYDYGPEYKAIVDMCDWSLVFDADYYMKEYPMLAYLYNYDKDLLLEHFQTVGIHEGRQASSKFNVGAYLYNCSDKVYNAFAQNYEGYYLYYMTHYDTEKNVNTVTANNGKTIKKQYKNVLTIIQSEELKYINQYRAEVNVEDVAYNGELQAFANYRAYINVKENWDAHDWTIAKGDGVWDYIKMFTNTDGNSFGENNITMGRSSENNLNTSPFYNGYRNSKKHYEAMVSSKYAYVGVSNAYFGTNNKLNTYKKDYRIQGAQFDLYLNYIKK